MSSYKYNWELLQDVGAQVLVESQDFAKMARPSRVCTLRYKRPCLLPEEEQMYDTAACWHQEQKTEYYVFTIYQT